MKLHSWISALGQQGTEAEPGRLGVLGLTYPFAHCRPRLCQRNAASRHRPRAEAWRLRCALPGFDGEHSISLEIALDAIGWFTQEKFP